MIYFVLGYQSTIEQPECLKMILQPFEGPNRHDCLYDELYIGYQLGEKIVIAIWILGMNYQPAFSN